MSEPQFQDLAPETPVCAECEHLVGRRAYTESAREWKCAFQENVLNITKDAVTGTNVYHYQFATCYDCRADARGCGPAGQWFKKYIAFTSPPRSLIPGKKPGGPTKTAEELLGELDI